MIDLTTGALYISAHVIERWRERVADVDPAAAVAAVEAFCRSGLILDEPPGWIADFEAEESKRYVVNEAVPHVAVAARELGDGLALVTVLIRQPVRPTRERVPVRSVRAVPSRSYEARRRRRLLFASLKEQA